MFNYYVDKYCSLSAAVKNCGNRKIQSDETIKAAMRQIEIAEAAIRHRAGQIEDAEPIQDE